MCMHVVAHFTVGALVVMHCRFARSLQCGVQSAVFVSACASVCMGTCMCMYLCVCERENECSKQVIISLFQSLLWHPYSC